MADSKTSAEPQPAGNPNLAVITAWLVPGAGHLYLGRRLRAAAFFVIVVVTFVVGWQLGGKLYTIEAGKPMSILGLLGELGLGTGYLLLRVVFDYQGSITAASYEYGTAFLLTAGLMNILLILDAWDIARGRKL